MRIYHIEQCRDRRAERDALSAQMTELKIAAGAEDMSTLPAEAMKSFRIEGLMRNSNNYLKELALRHINDLNPDFENMVNDPEFIRAEKLFRLEELAIRVAPAVQGRNIREITAAFVSDQRNTPSRSGSY